MALRPFTSKDIESSYSSFSPHDVATPPFPIPYVLTYKDNEIGMPNGIVPFSEDDVREDIDLTDIDINEMHSKYDDESEEKFSHIKNAYNPERRLIAPYDAISRKYNFAFEYTKSALDRKEHYDTHLHLDDGSDVMFYASHFHHYEQEPHIVRLPRAEDIFNKYHSIRENYEEKRICIYTQSTYNEGIFADVPKLVKAEEFCIYTYSLFYDNKWYDIDKDGYNDVFFTAQDAIEAAVKICSNATKGLFIQIHAPIAMLMVLQTRNLLTNEIKNSIYLNK